MDPIIFGSVGFFVKKRTLFPFFFVILTVKRAQRWRIAPQDHRQQNIEHPVHNCRRKRDRKRAKA